MFVHWTRPIFVKTSQVITRPNGRWLTQDGLPLIVRCHVQHQPDLATGEGKLALLLHTQDTERHEGRGSSEHTPGAARQQHDAPYMNMHLCMGSQHDRPATPAGSAAEPSIQISRLLVRTT